MLSDVNALRVEIGNGIDWHFFSMPKLKTIQHTGLLGNHTTLRVLVTVTEFWVVRDQYGC